MIAGEYLLADDEIEINAGRTTRSLDITNMGDRPVQVGSHFHFFEVNDGLTFDREQACGYRLNIPAGTAVRFEPGQTRRVELVELAGLATVYGFQGRIMGALSNNKNNKES